MHSREYCAISAALFSIVAVAHLARVAFAVPVDIGGVLVPVWMSVIGVAIPATLAAWGFRIALAR